MTPISGSSTAYFVNQGKTHNEDAIKSISCLVEWKLHALAPDLDLCVLASHELA